MKHGLVSTRVEGMGYSYAVTSTSGFIQQAALYLRHGYWFFVSGHVPGEKNAAAVDEKLLLKYGVDVSKWTRARRKRLGHANLQYLRHGRLWVLFATHGKHAFFKEETNNIRDARKTPLRFAGYALSVRWGNDGKYHVHVRIDRPEYLALKAHFLDLARHRKAETLIQEFWALPFEPYAPVRRQLLNILRAVNKVRGQAGFEKLPFKVIPFKRRIVRPFKKDLLEGNSCSFNVEV